MFAVERQNLIVTMARDDGRVDVADLARHFSVTTETIRRDLTLLEQQGLLRRMHGGAMPIERFLVPDLTERRDLMAQAKRAIGRTAAGHLPETGSILLDAGTTTACLVEAIPLDRKLSVVTNALPSALALGRYPSLTVFLLGGRIRRESQATVEDWALNELSMLDVDVAFIAATGVSAGRGFSTPDPSEAAVKRAMIRSAKRSIVLADSTKIGHSYLSAFASASEIDLLVTDTGITDAAASELMDAGLRVQTAPLSGSNGSDP